jgi:hypothetical protein
LRACVQKFTTNEEQLGQAELADFEAPRRELFVFVETRDCFDFQHSDRSEPPVICVEGSADFQLHSRPGRVEFRTKSSSPCRADRALLLTFGEHRQSHCYPAEDNLIAFFSRVPDADAVCWLRETEALPQLGFGFRDGGFEPSQLGPLRGCLKCSVQISVTWARERPVYTDVILETQKLS